MVDGRWSFGAVGPDGRVRWSRFHHNLVVASAKKVVAAAMKGTLNSLYHAIGTGSPLWDSVMPNVQKTDTVLYDEYYRKAIATITHVDEQTGFHVVASPNLQDQLEATEFGAITDSTLVVGRLVEIIDGTNVGDCREITAISGNTITVDSPFTALPDATTKWRLGVVSNAPTGTIDIETTFTARDANAEGTIREEAIFGADATDELETGVLFSAIRHEPISKVNGTALSRLIRIRFDAV